MNKNKIENNESLTVIDNVTETIITNQETIDAIEEARRIAKEPDGWFYDLDEFFKAVYEE